MGCPVVGCPPSAELLTPKSDLLCSEQGNSSLLAGRRQWFAVSLARPPRCQILRSPRGLHCVDTRRDTDATDSTHLPRHRSPLRTSRPTWMTPSGKSSPPKSIYAR